MEVLFECIGECCEKAVIPCCTEICNKTASCDLNCRICEIRESCGLCRSSENVTCCNGWYRSSEMATPLTYRESENVGDLGYSAYSQLSGSGVAAGESMTCCDHVSSWACDNFICTILCCKEPPRTKKSPERVGMY